MGYVNFKKTYAEEEIKLYTEWEPEHTSVLPCVIIQWFKDDGKWADRIVYVGRHTEIPILGSE